MSANNQERFQFKRENYVLLAAGLAVIFIGFALMAGGKADDPSHFTRDIFNFRRLSLAPLVVMAGFGVVMAAILKKPAKDE